MITTDEVKRILAAIKIAYPNFKVENPQLAVDMYKAMFQDYTYEQVETGVRRFIATDRSGFAPSIGQIIDNIVKVKEPEELSEMAAWNLVAKALRNGNYGAEEEFNKLPPLVQKAVGAPSQLRMWAADDEFNESVVSSNFMRSYRAIVSRSHEDARIPQAIKDLITQTNVKGIEQAAGELQEVL